MIGIWVAKLGVRIMALGAWMEYPSDGYKYTLSEVRATIHNGAMYQIAVTDAMIEQEMVKVAAQSETGNITEGHC